MRRIIKCARARVEGGPAAAWQVLDYFDVIVHVMRADAREKYDLESLWGDAPRVGVARRGERRAETAATDTD